MCGCCVDENGRAVLDMIFSRPY